MDELVKRLAKIDACAVSDAMDRAGLKGAVIGLRPLWPCPRIAGRAVTVKLVPADQAPATTRHLCTAAVEAAGPGRIIVIDHGGRDYAAGWGGILSQAAKVKGVEGVVIDGAARDVDESRDVELPVYGKSAVTITARGRIVELNYNEPIQMGGVDVKPDDLVIADWSGVVFIPAERAEEVVSTAEMIAQREALMAADVRAGKSVVEVMGKNYETMLEKH